MSWSLETRAVVYVPHHVGLSLFYAGVIMGDTDKSKLLRKKWLVLFQTVLLTTLCLVMASCSTNNDNAISAASKPDEFYSYQNFVLEKTSDHALVEQIEKECDSFGYTPGWGEVVRFARERNTNPDFLGQLEHSAEFDEEIGLTETWIFKAGIEAQALYDVILAEDRMPTQEEQDRLSALVWIQCWQ